MRTSSAQVKFRYRSPGDDLSGFVGLFWFWQGHDAPVSKEWVLPSATAELVIRLESPRCSDSSLSGPRSRSALIRRTMRDEWLGVHFVAGGAFPFLGIPSGELHNGGVTLSDLWGEPGATELLERLHRASSVDAKFDVLEEWLLAVAKRPLEHHPAVGFALREFRRDPGLLSSAETARHVNLSQRRFIELFRDEVGMTPKRFCRLQRFTRVVEALDDPGSVDWTDVALACGYFDQAHFIHDFRGFSGLTPTQYLRLRDPLSPLHVKVPS